jgi:hypothetical protein
MRGRQRSDRAVMRPLVETLKVGVNVLIEEPGPDRRDEQRAWCQGGVPKLAVGDERVGGAWMQRNPAGLPELGVTGEHPRVRIEIGAVKADRLTDPHPGHRQQADQRPTLRLSTVCGSCRPRRAAHGSGVGVDERLGPPGVRREHIGTSVAGVGRRFGSPTSRAALRRDGCPLDGQGGCDRGGLAAVEKLRDGYVVRAQRTL